MKKYLIANTIGVETNLDLGLKCLEVRSLAEVNPNNLIIYRCIENIKFPSFHYRLGNTTYIDKNVIGKNILFIKFLMSNLNGKTTILFNRNAEKWLKIPQLLENVLYLKLLKNGFGMLHASAISKEKAIVFGGWQEVGKTEFTKYFIKKYGFKYLCDDRLIFKGKYAYPFPRNLSEYSKVPQIIYVSLPYIPTFIRKYLLRRKELHVPIEKNRREIEAIFFFQNSTLNRVERLSTKEAYIKSLLSLHYELSIMKHNLIKQWFYFNSTDPKDLEKQEEWVIKKLLSKVKIFWIEGDPSFRKKAVEKILFEG